MELKQIKTDNLDKYISKNQMIIKFMSTAERAYYFNQIMKGYELNGEKIPKSVGGR